MKRTISIEVGKGSLNHNSRKFKASNVDKERTDLNIEFCNEDIQDVYHELFDEALEKYNARQTRSDRIIKDYYEKISRSKQEKTFHEIIIQVGDKFNTNVQSQEGDVAVKILDEYFRGFEKRNPSLKVFSAHIHLDESTPHLHIDFVPFTTGSKRGLETRVSLKQALKNQGFVSDGRGDTEWAKWAQSEKEELANIMNRYGIEWEQKNTHAPHLSVLDYKKQERSKEVELLDEQIKDKQDEFDVVSKRVKNYDKGYEQLRELDEKLETSQEFQLPEPQGLMTAKAYKTKVVDPFIKKLKDLIRTVLARAFEGWDNYSRLNLTNAKLYRENEKLSKRNDKLTTENENLKRELKDFHLLKDIFGIEEIGALVNKAKEYKEIKKAKKEQKVYR